MPPIDAPTTVNKCSMERHARLRLAVRRRRTESVADRIGRDDEIAIGIECLTRSDQIIQPVMIAADRRRHQDRIRLRCVERAVGLVRN
jgi:hypothetical protein